MVAFLLLAIAPAASALVSTLAGPSCGALVCVWRALRDRAAAAMDIVISAPSWADAGLAAFLIALAAGCDGAGRGGISMVRALAHGWRMVNRVSAPRTGPTRPVTGAGQAPLALAYFLASVLVGAMILSQLLSAPLSLLVSALYIDFNLAEYAVMSVAVGLACALIGLRWTPVSFCGGLVLFAPYALLALALRGWRVLVAAALAAAVAAAVLAYLAA